MSESTGRYHVSADRQRSILYLDLTGRLSREQLSDAARETIVAAASFDGEFHIVNDLRGFAPPSPKAASPIGAAQADLSDMGLYRAVRIVDDETSEVVVDAFERRSRKAGYNVERAASIEAATAMLTGNTQQASAVGGAGR